MLLNIGDFENTRNKLQNMFLKTEICQTMQLVATADNSVVVTREEQARELKLDAR